MLASVWAKRNRVLPLAVASMVFPAAAVFAQLQSGRIVGTIYDPQHAAVPVATVTVTDLATNISRSVVTDSAGDYVITPLDPGVYKLSAAAAGFQTTVRTGIELVVGQAARVDLTLTIGEPTTQVQVTAEAPLLNTEAGTLGQVITNTQIVDLPLNGRGFHELARLTPGTALLAATGNVQKVRPEWVNGNIISGVKGSQTTFLLDGVDVTEQHQGGTWIQTSIDALQEFTVQQNAFSAEFARAGGTFNSTTKSGTNSFHGTLFEFLRNDKLDSRNFFAQSREILKRNQFGGTFGGPVWIPKVYNGKDKTFFFVSYEGQRQREGQVNNSNVPTAAERNGDYSAPGLNQIYDPLSTAPSPSGSGTVRSVFPGNVIPAARLSSQAIYFNDNGFRLGGIERGGLVPVSRQPRRRQPASEPHWIGQPGQSLAGGLLRQERLRGAGELHLGQLRRQHPQKRLRRNRGSVVVQAVPGDGEFATAIPRRGLQPAERRLLQCAEQQHRCRFGRAGDRHVE